MRFRVWVLVLILLVTVCGCAARVPKDTGLRVLATFYPVYVATLNVVGDTPGVTVSNMASPDVGCLHEYQLTTKDMKAIAGARIIVKNGAGMEPFLDAALGDWKGEGVIDASEGLEVLTEDGEPNPHIWVALDGAIGQVTRIAQGLAKLDPAHADAYAENAQKYSEKLAALRDTMKQELAPAKGSPVITFHEAFPYFAQEFGLDVVAVVEREPGEAPTTAELRDTIELVRQYDVRALYAEPQYERTAADTIARDTGVAVYTLDPVVTGPLEDPDAYIAAMQKNLAVLKESLLR